MTLFYTTSSAQAIPHPSGDSYRIQFQDIFFAKVLLLIVAGYSSWRRHVGAWYRAAHMLNMLHQSRLDHHGRRRRHSCQHFIHSSRSWRRYGASFAVVVRKQTKALQRR